MLHKIKSSLNISIIFVVWSVIFSVVLVGCGVEEQSISWEKRSVIHAKPVVGMVDGERYILLPSGNGFDVVWENGKTKWHFDVKDIKNDYRHMFTVYDKKTEAFWLLLPVNDGEFQLWSVGKDGPTLIYYGVGIPMAPPAVVSKNVVFVSLDDKLHDYSYTGLKVISDGQMFTSTITEDTLLMPQPFDMCVLNISTNKFYPVLKYFDIYGVYGYINMATDEKENMSYDTCLKVFTSRLFALGGYPVGVDDDVMFFSPIGIGKFDRKGRLKWFVSKDFFYMFASARWRADLLRIFDYRAKRRVFSSVLIPFSVLPYQGDVVVSGVIYEKQEYGLFMSGEDVNHLYIPYVMRVSGDGKIKGFRVLGEALRGRVVDSQIVGDTLYLGIYQSYGDLFEGYDGLDEIRSMGLFFHPLWKGDGVLVFDLKDFSLKDMYEVPFNETDVSLKVNYQWGSCQRHMEKMKTPYDTLPLIDRYMGGTLGVNGECVFMPVPFHNVVKVCDGVVKEVYHIGSATEALGSERVLAIFKDGSREYKLFSTTFDVPRWSYKAIEGSGIDVMALGKGLLVSIWSRAYEVSKDEMARRDKNSLPWREGYAPKSVYRFIPFDELEKYKVLYPIVGRKAVSDVPDMRLNAEGMEEYIRHVKMVDRESGCAPLWYILSPIFVGDKP